MNCYLCDDAPGLGGTRLRDLSAVGICQGCGVGLCRRHGHRSPDADFTLLCPDCRARAERKAARAEHTEVAAR